MTLLEIINKDFTSAMKERRGSELSTLRMLRAAIKNRQIELMSGKAGSGSAGHEFSEEEVLAVVKSQIKQLKDSIDAFRSGGRADLVEKAKDECTVLERYLPAQLSDEALEAVVKESLSTSGASSKADMGRAMGATMKAVSGRADGARVKAIVEKLLVCITIAVTGILLWVPSAFAATKSANTALSQQTTSSDLFSGEMPEFAYRLARAFSVMFAILFICTMLVGAFQQMTSSGKDEVVQAGRRKIAIGFFGALFMVMVYYLATNALRVL